MTNKTFSLLVALLLPAALATTAAAQSPTGRWDVNVNAAGTDYPSVLTLYEQDGGALAGTYGPDSAQGAALQHVQFASDTLRFEFDNPEYGRMSVQGVVRGNAFDGTLRMSFGEFPMTGARKASSGPGLSTKSLMRDLLANEKARAILEKHVPGMTTHPQIGDTAGMSLIEVAAYSPGQLNEQVLKAIDEDLSRL